MVQRMRVVPPVQQVRVWSTIKLKVTVVNDEQDLQELEHFSIWKLVQYFVREQTNETTVSISLFSNKTCFRVDPSDSYPLYTKSPFYVLLMGGWSFSLYIIQLVFRNLQIILKDHWHLAIGYTIVVGFISFAVCYRYGPLVEERSINILSWTLQIFGLLLVYAGIQVQQVALAIMIAAFCSKNLEYPFTKAFMLYQKLKPKKLEPRHLLTEEEYQRQSEVETQKALEELRKYCGSPEFNTWKTVSRLQSPKRFADFIEGSPHLLSNEVSVHTQEYGLGGSFFEDELFSTDEEEQEEEEKEEEEGWETDDDVKPEAVSPRLNNTRVK
ncbi:Nuclear envelope integral membrane protein 1a [Anabarilius grahami]|uniref:Nuclear envelope integral membrane protein 1a n=1 Tax=Anabarilius grahami TaxID=495550 RepID=A0A3N0YL67_ANAGA|nr:Nuclear envelope integral membrane protein 1a [Anabarilius grahami]